jgi:HK97 family phage major capsid protein
MSIETKMDAIGSAFEEFKKLNDKRIKELEQKGFETAETKSAVEKANADIDRLSQEVKAAQAAVQRAGTAGTESKGGQSEEQKLAKQAFRKFMAKGAEKLSAEEVKALSVGSDPDGGYLVLPEMSSEIVKKVYESSPMRQLASVATISSDQLEIIEDLDEVDASWVGESAARSETDTAQLKKIVIAVHELYAKPKATQKLLDDAMLNVEAWLAEKVADKFARSEATAFMSGNGVGKPRGILSYAAGTSFQQIEQVVSGSAAAITADGLIGLSYSLKAAYKAGAAFMLKRASVAEVRKLKDDQKQYLWQPSLQLGQPDMLLGFPMYEADDMETIAANALPIAFGNFKAGYQIVDRFGIRVLRDPFSSKPNVEFYTTKRVGGDVKNFEAIKLLKCSV